MPTINQQDWDALASAYGRASAELLVWQRVAAEREAELTDLRAQVAAVSDRLYQAPESEEGG